MFMMFPAQGNSAFVVLQIPTVGQIPMESTPRAFWVSGVFAARLGRNKGKLYLTFYVLPCVSAMGMAG